MKIRSYRNAIECDGCGYVIAGLHGDLSNRKDHDLIVLDRYSETFHFHGASHEGKCFDYFLNNPYVQVRALMDRKRQEIEADHLKTAVEELATRRKVLEERFKELVSPKVAV